MGIVGNVRESGVRQASDR